MLKNLLSKSLQNGLQEALQMELYQSNLWKHTANHLQRLGFFGGQKYFLKESAEELTHYQLIVDFINDMGSVAQMPEIEAVKDEINSIEDALEIAYNTEVEVLNMYKMLYKKAEEEDCTVGQFLLQFIEIQRLAVGAYSDLISRYQKCGKNEAAILEFDEYLGEQ